MTNKEKLIDILKRIDNSLLWSEIKNYATKLWDGVNDPLLPTSYLDASQISGGTGGAPFDDWVGDFREGGIFVLKHNHANNIRALGYVSAVATYITGTYQAENDVTIYLLNELLQNCKIIYFTKQSSGDIDAGQVVRTYPINQQSDGQDGITWGELTNGLLNKLIMSEQDYNFSDFNFHNVNKSYINALVYDKNGSIGITIRHETKELITVKTICVAQPDAVILETSDDIRSWQRMEVKSLSIPEGAYVGSNIFIHDYINDLWITGIIRNVNTSTIDVILN